MEVFQHLTIEHNEEDAILNDIIRMDNEKADIHMYKRKEAEGKKESSFVLSESIAVLDEYC